MRDFVDGTAFNHEQGQRSRKLFAAVVLAALDDAIADDKKYGNGPIKCVDVKTGEVKWEQPGFGPGNVVLVDGHLLALSDTGELYLIKADPSGYREVAKTKVLDGKCWTTPVISNGRIYARSTTEAVCLDVSAGAVASR